MILNLFFISYIHYILIILLQKKRKIHKNEDCKLDWNVVPLQPKNVTP